MDQGRPPLVSSRSGQARVVTLPQAGHPRHGTPTADATGGRPAPVRRHRHAGLVRSGRAESTARPSGRSRGRTPRRSPRARRRSRRGSSSTSSVSFSCRSAASALASAAGASSISSSLRDLPDCDWPPVSRVDMVRPPRPPPRCHRDDSTACQPSSHLRRDLSMPTPANQRGPPVESRRRTGERLQQVLRARAPVEQRADVRPACPAPAPSWAPAPATRARHRR